MNNTVKHNGDIYTYYLGSDNILIKTPDGRGRFISKYLIKGKSKPNFLKKILNRGERNFSIDHEDMVRYIKENY